jgi:hypothetical protein
VVWRLPMSDYRRLLYPPAPRVFPGFLTDPVHQAVPFLRRMMTSSSVAAWPVVQPRWNAPVVITGIGGHDAGIGGHDTGIREKRPSAAGRVWSSASTVSPSAASIRKPHLRG